MSQDPVHASPTDPGIRPLRAAHACTNAKTPSSAFPLVTGSLGTSCWVPPAGFEPAHTAPEAVALSPELRGRVGCVPRARRRVEHYQLWWGGHERFPWRSVGRPSGCGSCGALVRGSWLRVGSPALSARALLSPRLQVASRAPPRCRAPASTSVCRVPRTGWKWGKPGRAGRAGPTLKVCQALRDGCLLWTTTRSSGS